MLRKDSIPRSCPCGRLWAPPSFFPIVPPVRDALFPVQGHVQRVRDAHFMFGNAFYLFAIIFACSVENIAQTYPRGRGHLFSLFAMVLGLLFFPPSIFSILSFFTLFSHFFYLLSLSLCPQLYILHFFPTFTVFFLLYYFLLKAPTSSSPNFFH